MENTCAIEGFADFIGPLSRVYQHTQPGKRDERLTTGGDQPFGKQMQPEWAWISRHLSIAPLDAPQQIAAGGMRGYRSKFDDDNDRNIFQQSIRRN